MFGSPEEHAAQAHSRVGTMLRGKYRIDRVLGVGGMASVYAATHRNGRRVAVKVLHATVSLQGDMRKRFLREGHVANAVNHPGAVVVIDDDIAEDEAPFLVMELLDGVAVETLWERNGERLPADLVLAIAYELCGVLDAAHRAGIVHRDIKPANLFLTHEGQLKVLDFGLAQLQDGQSKLTANGMVFGTPAFMAPEQASGRLSQVDATSDIWAVGATMFTLLSGQTVHVAPTVPDVLVLAATKPARPLASVLPNADPRLLGLVDRALTLVKAERWPSAEAMRAAICVTNQALFGEAIPNLKRPSELPNLHKSRASNFSLVDLSKHSGDMTDEDVPSATDIVVPEIQDGAVVDLSRDANPASEEDEKDATQTDMASARDLDDSSPPDLSDDGPETKSDAPTSLYEMAAPMPPLPPARPPPKTGWSPLQEVIDTRHLSQNGEARPPELQSDLNNEAETLVHLTLHTPSHPMPVPQALATPHGLAVPPSSRELISQRFPIATLQPSTTAGPPTITHKVNMRFTIARGVLASLERDGIAKTFRAHPGASVAVLVGGLLLLVLVLGLATARVSRLSSSRSTSPTEIEPHPHAAPAGSTPLVRVSDTAVRAPSSGPRNPRTK